MQFAWEQANGSSVPSPIDHTGKIWHWDKGANEAEEMALAHISHVLDPPYTKGASLGGGYDPYNHYDVGHLSPTRFGPRTLLQRAIAIRRRNGLGTLEDRVLAHMDGGRDNGYTYDYKSAAGKPGRFPKDKTCFVGGNIKRDNVAAPTEDFSGLFGRQLSYFSGRYANGIDDNRRGYVLRKMLDCVEWRSKSLDLDGCRYDNTKSLDPAVIRQMQKRLGNPFAVGEFYSGDPGRLAGWINQVAGTCSTFDFNLYDKLRPMCNGSSQWDMNQLRGAGFCQQDSMHAVTFAENHDTDTGGYPIIFNKAQAYFIVMMFVGLPCIYYKDWSTDPGCYGLKKHINNYLWIRATYAGGALTWRYTDGQLAVFTRDGYGSKPGVLCAVNNDMYGGWKKVNVQTPFGANRMLHDFTGHNPANYWTDWAGRVTIWVPPNDNGLGTVAYAPVGNYKPAALRPSTTKQILYGADDLDLDQSKTLADTQPTTVFPIWCEASSDVVFRHVDVDPRLTFALQDDTGAWIIDGSTKHGKTKRAGWHSVMLHADSAAPLPFALEVEYLATEGL